MQINTNPIDRFVAIESTPGYMPEDSEPFETEDYSEAVAYANELADGLEEQGVFLRSVVGFERQLLRDQVHAPGGKHCGAGSRPGKSPAQRPAFGPLRELQPEWLIGDLTLEALARELAGQDGAVSVELDELAVLLQGLGEYKHGRGADQRRFLEL